MDHDSPLYEAGCGPGDREQRVPPDRGFDGVRATSGLLLNRHGFLLLQREGGVGRERFLRRARRRRHALPPGRRRQGGLPLPP